MTAGSETGRGRHLLRPAEGNEGTGQIGRYGVSVTCHRGSDEPIHTPRAVVPGVGTQNVGGWARERAQKDRDGRAHPVRDQGPMFCGAGAMGDSRWVMSYGALQRIFATAFRRLTGSRETPGSLPSRSPSSLFDRPHRLAPNESVFLIPLCIAGMELVKNGNISGVQLRRFMGDFFPFDQTFPLILTYFLHLRAQPEPLIEVCSHFPQTALPPR